MKHDHESISEKTKEDIEQIHRLCNDMLAGTSSRPLGTQTVQAPPVPNTDKLEKEFEELKKKYLSRKNINLELPVKQQTTIKYLIAAVLLLLGTLYFAGSTVYNTGYKAGAASVEAPTETSAMLYNMCENNNTRYCSKWWNNPALTKPAVLTGEV